MSGNFSELMKEVNYSDSGSTDLGSSEQRKQKISWLDKIVMKPQDTKDRKKNPKSNQKEMTSYL